jgi:hypothetical protein
MGDSGVLEELSGKELGACRPSVCRVDRLVRPLSSQGRVGSISLQFNPSRDYAGGSCVSLLAMLLGALCFELRV